MNLNIKYRLFKKAFLNRETSAGDLSSSVLRSISEQLSIDEATSGRLLKNLSNLISKIIFDSRNELDQVQAVFGGCTLPANLVSLISKLVHDKLPGFKKILTDSQSKQ